MLAFRSSVLLFLFAAVLAFSMRGPARAAEIDPALVAAAKKEGRVVLYTPMIVDQIVRPLAAAFREKYGIEVQYQRLDSAAVVLKILNEYRARRSEADVFSTSLGIESLIASKAARKIESASAAELPAHYKDSEGYWAANRLYVLGPAMNTRQIKAEDFPKTFEDLLDPKYTGKIVWRRNNLTGATGFVGNVLVTMGEEKGMEYLRKLARQRLITVSISDRAVLDQIIAGEYAMTIAHDQPQRRDQPQARRARGLEPARNRDGLLRTNGADDSVRAAQCRQAVSRIRDLARGADGVPEGGLYPDAPGRSAARAEALARGRRLQGQRVHARLCREEPQALGRHRRDDVPLTASADRNRADR